MEKKKYIVYYNDEVNVPVDVFTSDTLEECKKWIDGQIEGMTPVDEEHPCTDDVMYSSKTFFYEVYDRPMIKTVNDEDIFNEAVYMTDYYYAD